MAGGWGGQQAASGSYDGCVRLWDLSGQASRCAACCLVWINKTRIAEPSLQHHGELSAAHATLRKVKEGSAWTLCVTLILFLTLPATSQPCPH